MAIPDEAKFYLGQRLNNRYEIQSFVAPGGFCLVFEAKDAATDDTVALKILQQGASTDGAIEFETEQDLLASLVRSSNVVTFINGDTDTVNVTAQGTNAVIALPVRYMALELADACMTELLVHRASLDWRDRLALFRGVAKGLHQMHLALMVHRDLKSENVLLFQGRKAADAKVADLGRSRLTTVATRFSPQDYFAGRGDLRFAPPELLFLQGQDSPHCWRCVDLYLLGSVFFEVVTGQGLTSLAFGYSPGLIRRMAALPAQDRAREYQAQLPDIRSKLEHAYVLCESELPRAIRDQGMRLLRQLTDPEPSRREQRRFGKVHQPWSLEWVLRKLDIMLLQLDIAEKEKTARKKRKGNA